MNSSNELIKTGERLRELRIEKDLSLDDVARVTGISKSLLSKYERGLVDAGISQIAKLTKYYNVSLDWLLGFTEDRRPIVSYENHPLEELTDENKQEALKFIRFLKNDSTRK